ncbi:LuxE/PaaK family acyltransferase [Lentiprolixibacter aurantiacus]|uniref:Acyl transferase n=1 Tax=Lentiprolixibacter aurantiacus TaxID=2993939 RepID=A0AAE3SM95_9FLAO|nr:acyl transferase [Lentiprolixibacter aurantiacus]MCX2718215.1 acyl transferase [Lentiprolixibacter aurantiacus]
MDSRKIFTCSPTEFDSLALEIFRYQYRENIVYNAFCKHLQLSPDKVRKVEEIPFLPIQFFKSHQILTGKITPELTFTSSGTTGQLTSKHLVAKASVYRNSFLKSFRLFYGDPEDYCILALLPSYLEREGSSLVYMVNDLINKSGHPESGFYLHEHKKLAQKLVELDSSGIRVLLIGVSFALLDLVQKYTFSLKNTVVMETGGMKGRKKEMIREELHTLLKQGFGTVNIHSEYGMTELLSQAYSRGHGKFECPTWMRVMIRDPEDPLTLLSHGKSGGVNIIDLANLYSCSFIATQDLGKLHPGGSFEILGRFDHSDLRGCNLMAL